MLDGNVEKKSGTWTSCWCPGAPKGEDRRFSKGRLWLVEGRSVRVPSYPGPSQAISQHPRVKPSSELTARILLPRME